VIHQGQSEVSRGMVKCEGGKSTCEMAHGDVCYSWWVYWLYRLHGVYIVSLCCLYFVM